MTHPLQGTLENRDDRWVLTLTRDFGHPPEKLWPWLTDPDRLRQWSPIVPDRALDSIGPREAWGRGWSVRTPPPTGGKRCATNTPTR